MFKKSLLAVTIAAASVSVSAAETPSMAEMWEMIQQQQAEIKGLKKELGKAESKIQQTEIIVVATADALEVIEEKGVASSTSATNWEKTSIGGYGELHYNNLDNQYSGPGASDDTDKIDFHRFVLFFGHEFTEKTRFFSEFELEHALSGDGKPGEVELEQAYIEHDYAENHSFKAGQFLVPVGILNETHEPDTFYGTERNNVEKNIIPTTWWEAGLNMQGYIAEGLRYDAAVTSGLYIEDGDYKVRSGRQKVANAKADDFAYTGRLKYTGLKGLELAATLQYQSDLFQGESRGMYDGADATLFEAHATYTVGGFGLRALYAQWDMDSDYEQATGKLGADQQLGWYVEPSFKFSDSIGVFARYGEWDNQAGSSIDTQYEQWDIGVNYWLTPQVVFKADYQDQTTPTAKDEFDGFNLGVGYSF